MQCAGTLPVPVPAKLPCACTLHLATPAHLRLHAQLQTPQLRPGQGAIAHAVAKGEHTSLFKARAPGSHPAAYDESPGFAVFKHLNDSDNMDAALSAVADSWTATAKETDVPAAQDALACIGNEAATPTPKRARAKRSQPPSPSPASPTLLINPSANAPTVAAFGQDKCSCALCVPAANARPVTACCALPENEDQTNATSNTTPAAKASGKRRTSKATVAKGGAADMTADGPAQDTKTEHGTTSSCTPSHEAESTAKEVVAPVAVPKKRQRLGVRTRAGRDMAAAVFGAEAANGSLKSDSDAVSTGAQRAADSGTAQPSSLPVEGGAGSRKSKPREAAGTGSSQAAVPGPVDCASGGVAVAGSVAAVGTEGVGGRAAAVRRAKRLAATSRRDNCPDLRAAAAAAESCPALQASPGAPAAPNEVPKAFTAKANGHKPDTAATAPTASRVTSTADAQAAASPDCPSVLRQRSVLPAYSGAVETGGRISTSGRLATSATTSLQRLAHAVAAAQCLDVKEVMESVEFVERVRRRVRRTCVLDLAAGHGLVGMLLAAVEPTVEYVMLVDHAQPKSHALVRRAIASLAPWTLPKLTYFEYDLDDLADDFSTTSALQSTHPSDSSAAPANQTGTDASSADMPATRSVPGAHLPVADTVPRVRSWPLPWQQQWQGQQRQQQWQGQHGPEGLQGQGLQVRSLHEAVAAVHGFAERGGVGVVAVHACGDLTDTCLDIAVGLRAPVAVMPCCYTGTAKGAPLGVKRALGVAMASDVNRSYSLAATGLYSSVDFSGIPDTITPANRIIVAQVASRKAGGTATAKKQIPA